MKNDPSDPSDVRLDSLFAAVREAGYRGLEVEHGFETRLMARIRAGRERRSPFFLWTWRLMPAFLSIVVLMGIWVFISESHSSVDLSAITRIGNEDSTVVAFLAGDNNE